MSDKEYFNQIAAAIKAVSDGCAKYMQRNPNAKYKDANGKEVPISVALDVARAHARAITDLEQPKKEDDNDS